MEIGANIAWKRFLYFFERIIDAIFPKFCMRCDKEGVWMCDMCSKKLQQWKVQGCSVCKKNSETILCGDCAKTAPVSFLFSAYSYTDPFVQKIIYALKYEYISEIGARMGTFLADRYRNSGYMDISDSCVVPVPIHIKRFRDRGFNQSELIARVFAKKMNVPYVSNAIKRVVHTQSQVNLSGYERMQNIAEAFAVCDMSEIQDKVVYLIDDVCTTGATLLEAARTLKCAGAKDVIGVTFAREE